MKIAVLGTGNVGQTISLKLFSLDHEVMIGTRNVEEKMANKEKDMYGNPPFAEWITVHNGIKLGTFEEAAAFGDMIFNCTMGIESVNILTMAGEANVNGKVIADVSNPLDFSKGMTPVLSVCNTTSVGEEIQAAFPNAKVVKTLNTMWCGLMVNPAMLNGGDHTVFISGNDAGAKKDVVSILKSFGWMERNIMDLGDISTSRGPEMTLPLWLRIYGVTSNGAFNIKVIS